MLVVGGGLMGCAVARDAALRGASVAVLERGAPAREASWAAAGMLSPLSEASGPGAFLELGLESLRLFPEFAAVLHEESGVDPELRPGGKLLLALTEEEEESLHQRLAWMRASELGALWLDAVDTRRKLPGATPEARGALWLSGEASVNPRTLGESARRAALAARVRFLHGQGAAALLVRDGRAAGVRVRGGGTLHASSVVLAAGAWSGCLRGLPRPLPVEPVRGQMIALAGFEAPMETMVGGAGAYLVPRERGGAPRVWVGATVERTGFDKRTTADARGALHGAAARILPALRDASVTEHWAGLRPGTPDGLPILGEDPDLPGLVYATGHFRNGILLAPVTAMLIGRVLAGERPPELRAFRVERFTLDIGPPPRHAF